MSPQGKSHQLPVIEWVDLNLEMTVNLSFTMKGNKLFCTRSSL